MMLSELHLVYRCNAPLLMANKIPNQNIHPKFKWWSSYSISKAFLTNIELVNDAHMTLLLLFLIIP